MVAVRLALVFALVAALAAGCGGGGTAQPTTAAVEQHNPAGDPAVWERIEYGTDCASLQTEWGQAMDNAEARQQQGLHDRLTDLSLDYAAAASQRMRDLGCT